MLVRRCSTTIRKYGYIPANETTLTDIFKYFKKNEKSILQSSSASKFLSILKSYHISDDFNSTITLYYGLKNWPDILKPDYVIFLHGIIDSSKQTYSLTMLSSLIGILLEYTSLNFHESEHLLKLLNKKLETCVGDIKGENILKILKGLSKVTNGNNVNIIKLLHLIDHKLTAIASPKYFVHKQDIRHITQLIDSNIKVASKSNYVTSSDDGIPLSSAIAIEVYFALLNKLRGTFLQKVSLYNTIQFMDNNTVNNRREVIKIVSTGDSTFVNPLYTTATGYVLEEAQKQEGKANNFSVHENVTDINDYGIDNKGNDGDIHTSGSASASNSHRDSSSGHTGNRGNDSKSGNTCGGGGGGDNDDDDNNDASRRVLMRPVSRKSKQQYHISSVEFKPIGYFESCFIRKYGTPRQGNIIAHSRGIIHITCCETSTALTLHGLEQYSHVVIIWLFHDNADSRSEYVSKQGAENIRSKRSSLGEHTSVNDGRDSEECIMKDSSTDSNSHSYHLRYTKDPSPKVSPPRLHQRSKSYQHDNTDSSSSNNSSIANSSNGEDSNRERKTTHSNGSASGNGRVGVFASRSPHRPNPIGLTICKIELVDVSRARILVSGVDLIHHTPILDIKPYIPRYDSFPHAVTPSWISSDTPLAHRCGVGGESDIHEDIAAAESSKIHVSDDFDGIRDTHLQHTASSRKGTLNDEHMIAHNKVKVIFSDVALQQLKLYEKKLKMFACYQDAYECLVAVLQDDMRSVKEKNTDTHTKYGLRFDVLNVIFDMKTTTIDGDVCSQHKFCEVVKIEYWPDNYD